MAEWLKATDCKTRPLCYGCLHSPPCPFVPLRRQDGRVEKRGVRLRRIVLTLAWRAPSIGKRHDQCAAAHKVAISLHLGLARKQSRLPPRLCFTNPFLQFDWNTGIAVEKDGFLDHRVIEKDAQEQSKPFMIKP